MPNRNLRIYRKVLEYRRLAISSGSCDSALFPMFRSCLYRAFRNSSSLSLGRNRACLPVSGFVLAVNPPELVYGTRLGKRLD
jgi:hypothetical protein